MPSVGVGSLPSAAGAPGPRVGMGLLFYPRGGSAFVVRELLPRLAWLGWPVRLFVGSVGAPGAPTHAGTFFRGLDVWPHDYSGAVEAFARGGDSLSRPVPMHPSYEDRLDAPDPIFTSVPPELLEPQVRAWQRTFAAGGMGRCELAHLHHLTPQADAVRRSWPHLPIVGHLHGTELKMLAELERRAGLARGLGTDLAGMARPTGRRGPGRGAGPVGAVAPRRLLAGLPARDRPPVRADRRGLVRRCRGGGAPAAGPPGAAGGDSQRGRHRAVRPAAARRAGPAVALAAVAGDGATGLGRERGAGFGPIPRGRPCGLRRPVDRAGASGRDVRGALHRGEATEPAAVRVRAGAEASGSGGDRWWCGADSPGEWEGEHPVTQVRRQGIDGVFFVGHRGHEDLPAGLACADVLAVPSVRESFGQVYLEAMASGLPVIATRSGGPPSFINVVPGRPTGWLVEPDDEDDLAARARTGAGRSGGPGGARAGGLPPDPRAVFVGRVCGAVRGGLRKRPAPVSAGSSGAALGWGARRNRHRPRAPTWAHLSTRLTHTASDSGQSRQSKSDNLREMDIVCGMCVRVCGGIWTKPTKSGAWVGKASSTRIPRRPHHPRAGFRPPRRWSGRS